MNSLPKLYYLSHNTSRKDPFFQWRFSLTIRILLFITWSSKTFTICFRNFSWECKRFRREWQFYQLKMSVTLLQNKQMKLIMLKPSLMGIYFKHISINSAIKFTLLVLIRTEIFQVSTIEPPFQILKSIKSFSLSYTSPTPKMASLWFVLFESTHTRRFHNFHVDK